MGTPGLRRGLYGGFINVPSPARTGVCRFVLTFATGYTFTTDVTFSEASEGSCPGCQDLRYIGTNMPVVKVPNPPDTCLAGDAVSD